MEDKPKSKVEQIEEKLSQPNTATEPATENTKSKTNTTSILGESQSAEDLMRALGIIK